MLDVLHFYLEEDSRFTSAEEADAVSALRTAIYSQMYHTTYKYQVKSSNRGRGSNATGPEWSDPEEVKPYIPPTEFNPESAQPFGSTLDAPVR